MNGLLIALLVFSALLNAGAVWFFIKWNKERTSAPTSEEIISEMKTFVDNVEEKNEELFRNLSEYMKVKEGEFQRRLQLLEDKPKAAGEEMLQPENGAPAKSPEEVGTLYKQGFSAKQIAKVLKMEQGEVELAITMIHRRKSYQQ